MTDTFHNNLINHSLAILNSDNLINRNKNGAEKTINKVKDNSSLNKSTYSYDISTNCYIQL